MLQQHDHTIDQNKKTKQNNRIKFEVFLGFIAIRIHVFSKNLIE